MNKHSLSVSIVPAIFISVALCAAAPAQQRTFVSTNGNDANSCLNTSPCRTFQRAHDAVAAGGEVVALNSGGFGPLIITKSVAITGDGVSAGISAAAGDAIFINTAGVSVTLRSLSMQGGGTATNGIHYSQGTTLHVEKCVINNFTANGINVDGAGSIFIKDTISRNNFRGALFACASCIISASVVDSRFENSTDTGFRVGGSSLVFAAVHNSVAAGNDNAGFFALDGANLNVDSCQAANNVSGIYSSASTLRVANSTITNNGTGLGTDTGGSILSLCTGVVGPGPACGDVATNTLEGNGVNGAFTGIYTAK